MAAILLAVIYISFIGLGIPDSLFGTARVTAFSTLLTAAALLGFSFSPSLWLMCFLALPLGIGAGAIDVGLNNYVALHYSAVHMSFLHCFYGIGVSVSPYVLSLVISTEAGWRGGLPNCLRSSELYHSSFVSDPSPVEKGAQ